MKRRFRSPGNYPPPPPAEHTLFESCKSLIHKNLHVFSGTLFLLTVICGLCFTACSSPTQETKSYTITFNANGATSGTAPTAKTANDGASITLPGDNGLAKTGYIFSGWNTKADGTGTNYTAGSSYTVTGTIILYAKWNPLGASATVTFNANGAVSGTAPTAQTTNAGLSITLPGDNGLAKPGYTFGGWNTNADGTGDNYAAGSSYTVTGTITLYAQWSAIPGYTFTITFNANGATGGSAPAAQTVNVGASITLPGDNGLEKTDYTFGGWNTDASGTGTNYSAGASYTPTDTIILYAQWNSSGGAPSPNPPPSTVTVTFNINGASGTVPSAQTVSADSSITLPNGSGFTRPGYTFGGWNTNAAGTGTNYAAGASYTVNATITLYAKWNAAEPGTIFVAFRGSGDETLDLTKSTDNNISMSQYQELTVTVNGDFDDWYGWYIDGIHWYSNWENSYTLYASWLSAGFHTLTVVVTKDGVPYSKAVTFRVIY